MTLPLLLFLLAADGKELFEKRCTGCHSLDADKVGPRLRAIYGKKAGTNSAFASSDAVKKSGVIWDSKSLDQWLADPDSLIPDNDMSFQVKDPAERAAIIEFLKRYSH
jgi:cytochrome c